jgi:hypothetical protein
MLQRLTPLSPRVPRLLQVQDRFDVDIKPLPDKIDSSTYMNTA